MPTNNDVEVCICGHDGTDAEDTPIKLLEIFVHAVVKLSGLMYIYGYN